MTLAAAQHFIQQSINDPTLVRQINAAADSASVRQILSELEMDFNYEEFEQAYYNVLTWCHTHQQADAVKEIKLWWDCLGISLVQSQQE